MMFGLSQIICSWTLHVQDLSNHQAVLKFDQTDDSSPLTVGLDIQQYSKRNFVSAKSTLTLIRPQKRSPQIMFLYISGEHLLKIWGRLDITGVRPAKKSRAMSFTSFGSLARPTAVTKRLHRYRHARLRMMFDLLSRAGCPRSNASSICNKIIQSCAVCKRSGNPASSRKYS